MIRKLFSSQLRINMFSGVVATVVNVVVLAIAYPVYLHFLGYEKYGVWLVLAVVLSFLQMGGNLGIEPAVTKLVAEEYGRNNMRGIQSYVAMAIAALIVSGTIGLVVILCFKTQIIHAFKLSSENATIASGLLPYIGLLCTYAFVTRALNATLAGLGRMDLTNYIQASSRVVILLVATMLLNSGRGIESLLIGNVASYFLIHIVTLIFIYRIVRVRFLRVSNWDNQRFRKLFQFGGGVFGSSVLGMLVGPFNKLMLSRYAGVETIPVYELAFRGATMFRSLFESAIRAIMPEISRLYGEGTAYARERVKSVNVKCMKMIGYLALPMYGMLILVAEPLLKLWLRNNFLESIPNAFRLMLVATFLSLVAVPAHYTIMGFGKVRYFVIAGIIGAGGNFVLVTAYYVLTEHVSVYSLGLCLIIIFLTSSIYIIQKARYLLAFSK